MKTYVLTVSRVFPCTHKRKGERTNFVCKILHTINFNESGVDLYRICSNECETSCFRRLIDPKLHTIRSNKKGSAFDNWSKKVKQIQKGEAILSIRYWSGKPYNSKQVEICQLDKDSGIGVQKIRFPFPNLHCFKIDEIEHQDMSLSKNDGLSYEDFKEWFKGYDLSKEMAIIHFTKFRY